MSRPSLAFAKRVWSGAVLTLLVVAIAACGGLSDADKQYNRGVDLLRESRFEEAIAAYDGAIRLDGTLAVAYHNRALAYENLGFVDKAVEDYGEAIRLNPQLTVAFSNRGGGAYTNLGKFQDAVNDLNRALDADPESATGHNYRGVAFLYLGEIDKSLNDLTEAIRLDPSLSVALRRGNV